jgi:hypothetical protein
MGAEAGKDAASQRVKGAANAAPVATVKDIGSSSR